MSSTAVMKPSTPTNCKSKRILLISLTRKKVNQPVTLARNKSRQSENLTMNKAGPTVALARIKANLSENSIRNHK